MEIKKEVFGKLPNGKSIDKIILSNNNGLEIGILTYGGIIQELKTSDLSGNFKDIVLGYDDIDGYINDPYYMGAIIGPVAGRISGATFPLNNETIKIKANAGADLLHSGDSGLHNKIWAPTLSKKNDSVKLTLSITAENRPDDFPGFREFTVSYILNNKNQLMIYFDAISDQDTVVNMTSHPYFNLSDSPKVYNHFMMINALKTLAVDADLIPNGDFDYVLGKPTNFSRGKMIRDALDDMKDGIDHVYVINKELGKFGITSKVVDEKSGRTIELVTDQPGLVFYTNNAPNGDVLGKGQEAITKHSAFCIEPQNFPNAPNNLNFPSIVLKAGDKYKSRNQFTFGLTSDTHSH